ncbi:MAG: hypothetical protein O9284_08000 [Steroidobacteraceae bacterium]|jgi:hypothetical protein|nr:hypothetical protein [Steroidobacteraceae bacterium]
MATPIPINVSDSGPETAYLARGVLDAGTLDTIRQTNAAFLAMVARRLARSPAGSPVLGLEPALAVRLVALEPAGREAITRCPYTLFNLRFEDAAFWRGVVLDASRPTPGVADDESTFARTAVFLAWHLAQTGDFTAALVLGMASEVQEAWRGLPLSGLDRAAMAALPHLQARWGGNARFWPDLLAAAEKPGAGQAERVRLLGLQLLAADGYRTERARRERRHSQP